MNLTVTLLDGEDKTLKDGDESNGEHFAKLEAGKQILPAFDRFLHGFDIAGNLVIIPLDAVKYVTVTEG